MTLGKLFTPMCLGHHAVKFGIDQKAVMLCGWGGNCSLVESNGSILVHLWFRLI